MSAQEDIEVLYRLLKSCLQRVKNGDERAKPAVTALEQLINEREISYEPRPRPPDRPPR